jgi:hypothetical protein
MSSTDQTPTQIISRIEDDAPVAAAPAAAAVSPKPGIQTTEFWLSSTATLLGIVMASGAIHDGGLAAQIIGGVLSVLAALGYTAARAKVKVGG